MTQQGDIQDVWHPGMHVWYQVCKEARKHTHNERLIKGKQPRTDPEVRISRGGY